MMVTFPSYHNVNHHLVWNQSYLLMWGNYGFAVLSSFWVWLNLAGVETFLGLCESLKRKHILTVFKCSVWAICKESKKLITKLYFYSNGKAGILLQQKSIFSRVPLQNKTCLNVHSLQCKTVCQCLNFSSKDLLSITMSWALGADRPLRGRRLGQVVKF